MKKDVEFKKDVVFSASDASTLYDKIFKEYVADARHGDDYYYYECKCKKFYCGDPASFDDDAMFEDYVRDYYVYECVIPKGVKYISEDCDFSEAYSINFPDLL